MLPTKPAFGPGLGVQYVPTPSSRKEDGRCLFHLTSFGWYQRRYGAAPERVPWILNLLIGGYLLKSPTYTAPHCAQLHKVAVPTHGRDRHFA